MPFAHPTAPDVIELPLHYELEDEPYFAFNLSPAVPPAQSRIASYSHTLDAGAAWGSAALQATLLGYSAHGATGIHLDKVHETLDVPEGYRAELAFVVGKRGDKSILPEGLAAREVPSPRKPLAEIAFEGSFKG